VTTLSLAPNDLMGFLAGAHAEGIAAHLSDLGGPTELDGRAWQHEANLGTLRLRIRVEFTSTGMTPEQAEAWIVAGDPNESPAERAAARLLLLDAGLPVPNDGSEADR
jgi:hypothetical protein